MSNVTYLYGTSETGESQIIAEVVAPEYGEAMGKVDVTHYHYNRRNIHVPVPVEDDREKPEANAVRFGIWVNPGTDIELYTCFQGVCDDGLQGITNTLPVFDLSINAAHDLIDLLQNAIRVANQSGD